MKPRKQTEGDASYIKRLEAANEGLRRDNKAQAKWNKRVGRSVSILAGDASLVFQAMAEKARVRSHPSVSAAVALLDSLVCPQWEKDSAPELKWPEEWDFDAPGAWSGDADMMLNAPIADAMEYFEARRFSAGKDEAAHIQRIITALEPVLRGRVDGVKESAGFVARPVTLPGGTHYKDFDREQLLALVDGLTWMALDLAQDMAFANDMLRRDLRAATYRRVADDLYRLAFLETGEGPSSFDVKVLGNDLPF